MSHSDSSRAKGNNGIIIVAAMMLFSMFFGAGNLIFPPVLGAQAADNFPPAILGFLTTGVLLPALAVIAIAITGSDIRSLTLRGGKVFGLIFPVLIYLSIGAFYALPRTATVSFSTIVTPNFGWDSWGSRIVFSAVFFAIALALAFEPTGIVDRLGKYLTPALLILLLVLIVMALVKMTSAPAAPAEDFQSLPYATGFVEGYLTMDSLAGLAFGIVVVSSIREKGVPRGPQLVSSVLKSAIIACLILGAVYLGLGVIGHRMPNGQSFSDGATLLAEASNILMGGAGAVVFGLIVLLACMTTAVGLLGACSEFFAALFTKVSYRAWLIIFTLIAFVVSTTGLETVIAIAGPIIGFLYPSAITLIFLTLFEPLTGRRLNMTFKLALIVSIVWAGLMTLESLGIGANVIASAIDWSPGHAQQLGWVVPTVIGGIIGFVIDLMGSKRAVRLGGETQAEAERRVEAQ
ncbi:branched-chain amino acid transport system II carrier protein [Rothia terrae]|uniref:branched-chain amino acid transport system II carrier protein n=1 Tax=Rothia terrae TaxID=396015 RepID=UPI00381701A8